LSYEECKVWVNSSPLTKNIVNSSDWDFKVKRELPNFIPKRPDITYERSEEWKGWDDFLNRNKPTHFNKKNFLSFNEAKKWIQNNELTKNVKKVSDWNDITRNLPNFIPKSPNIYYSKEWKGWGDFFLKK